MRPAPVTVQQYLALLVFAGRTVAAGQALQQHVVRHLAQAFSRGPDAAATVEQERCEQDQPEHREHPPKFAHTNHVAAL